MTESSTAPTPRRAAKAAEPKAASKAASKAAEPAPASPTAESAPVAATSVKAPAKPPRTARTRKPAAVAAPRPVPEPTHRHPNLGLAPIDMKAGFPTAAAALTRDREAIARDAIEAAIAADPDFRADFDDAGLRRLAHDTEVLIERLAMCVSSNDSRWLAEYAEWLGPQFRRRRVSQWHVVSVCEAVREIVGGRLPAEESAPAGRSLDAAIAVFRRNGRIGGDPHKRNALLKWLYRGV